MKLDTGSVNAYTWNDTRTGEVPCQNCGKPVVVRLPFIGCVFCSDCSGGRQIAYMMKKEAT